MIKNINIIVIVLGLFFISILISEPSFNGTAPGCAGGGCHDLIDGAVTFTQINDLQVEVTLLGVESGEKVAGELVDNNGNVVDVVSATNNNPFTLTAPSNGLYTVNAGYKKPQRKWDSVMVDLTIAGIEDPAVSVNTLRFELYPNHPNPFNNETIIQFSLPKAGNIELSIFNLRGQKIRTLSEEYYPAGIHILRWDGRDDLGNISASGVYFYGLRNGSRKITKRLILSK